MPGFAVICPWRVSRPGFPPPQSGIQPLEVTYHRLRQGVHGHGLVKRYRLRCKDGKTLATRNASVTGAPETVNEVSAHVAGSASNATLSRTGQGSDRQG